MISKLNIGMKYLQQGAFRIDVKLHHDLALRLSHELAIHHWSRTYNVYIIGQAIHHWSMYYQNGKSMFFAEMSNVALSHCNKYIMYFFIRVPVVLHTIMYSILHT